MNPLISTRRSAAWLCLALIALVVGFQSQATAAGCRYESHKEGVLSGIPEGRFVRNGLWTTGEVLRIYEQGQISYYQLPGGESPCDGPHCGGKPPSGSQFTGKSGFSVRVPESIPESRIGFCPATKSSDCLGVESMMLELPVLDGLLRPPRVL
ncbi:MAG: hypothetical protein AAF483_08850 [Planctomycetota bacterium]